MRIVVVGPGALGCLLTTLLAEAGQDVLLMDHRADRADFINRRGVTIEGLGGERRVRVKVSSSPADVFSADLVLICVKAYQTESAIHPLVSALGAEARILTLQNGLGNVEALAEACGADKVWGGVTAQGATMLGVGQIRHAGAGETVIGAVSPRGQAERLSEISDLFNQAGLPARVAEDVQSLIWSKLIVNVGINALTAVTHLRNGQLLDYPETRRVLEQAVAEAVAVVKALNIDLIYPDAEGRVKDVARATATNVASMLQDVLAKRRTEIDYINGAVAKHGREMGVPTPVNETLAGLVKTIELSYGRGV